MRRETSGSLGVRRGADAGGFVVGQTLCMRGREATIAYFSLE